MHHAPSDGDWPQAKAIPALIASEMFQPFGLRRRVVLTADRAPIAAARCRRTCDRTGITSCG